MRGKYRAVIAGTAGAFLAKAAGAAFLLVFNVLVARVLGPSDTGLYFLGVTVVMVGSVLARLGLDNAVLRDTARTASGGGTPDVHLPLGSAILLMALPCVAIAVLIWFSGGEIAQVVFRDPLLDGVLLRMLPAIPAYGVLMLTCHALLGSNRYVLGNAIQVAVMPIIGIALLVVLWDALTLDAVSLLYSGAMIIAASTALFVWIKTVGIPRKVTSFASVRSLLSSARPMLVTALLRLGFIWLAPVLIGIWATSAEVGIFGMAARVALATSFLLLAVNSVAAPKIAALYHHGAIEELRGFVGSVALLCTVVAFPIFLAIIILAGELMSLFGPGFESGANALRILAFGQLINSFTGPAAYLLSMSGNERFVERSAIVAVALSASVCWVLIPRDAVHGAAVGTSVGIIAQNILCVIFSWHRLRILAIPKYG